MVADIFFEMTAEYQLKKMQGLVKLWALVGLADDMSSEVVLSDEEKS